MSASPRRIAPAFLVLALALGGAAAGRGATLAERAAAIDAPARGGELTLDAPLQVGRAEIAPAAGTRVRALLAGGIPCGIMVDRLTGGDWQPWFERYVFGTEVPRWPR